MTKNSSHVIEALNITADIQSYDVPNNQVLDFIDERITKDDFYDDKRILISELLVTIGKWFLD